MSKPHNQQSRISKLSIGLGGFDFSKRIAGKYGILRRSGRLLSLVFSTSLGKKSDYKKINDYLWFHFGIYLKVIRQLIKTPSYHLQKTENFILKNEKPGFIGSGMQPIEFLRFVGKSAPSSYEKEGTIKKAISYENLYKDAHTTNITFLQRMSNVGNSSSEVKRVIHFQPYGIRSFDKERHSSGLHFIKITNVFPEERILIIEKIIQPLLQQSKVEKTISYENLYKNVLEKNILFPSYLVSRTTNIASNYARSINYRNLQSIYNTRNSNSEIKRVIHSQAKILNEIQKDSTVILGKTIQPLLKQTKVEKFINYENLYKDAPGKNILFPSYLTARTANIALNYTHPINVNYLQRVFNTRNSSSEIKRVIHFQPSRITPFDREMQSPGSNYVKILNEIQKDSVILGKTIQPLLKQTKVEEIVSYENLYKDAPGKNILFPSYLTSRTANTALNYTHPINVNYLQITSNVGNISSEIKRVIHFQPSRITSFDKERQPSRSHHAKILNQNQKDRTVILEKTIQPLLQQSKVEEIVSYENLYKDAPGKNILSPSYLISRTANIALNYARSINYRNLQSIFNTRNSSSEIKRVIHFQPSRITSFDKERRSSRSRHAKILNQIQKDRTVILEKTIQPLLQQTRVEKIINYKNLYKDAQGMKKRNPIGAPNLMDNMHSSLEMVFKKPVAQSTDIASENKEQLQVDRVNSNYITDSLIKESLEKKSVHEIGKIAGSVYKIIERKILIEKDRRGLF